MTEKRYSISELAKATYSDVYDGIDPLTNDEVVDLLNEQEERIQELETVMRQISYETRANYTKEEYSATVSISPQMHDKLTELITEVK